MTRGRGWRMAQVRLGVCQLLRGEDVAVLQTQVVLLVEETLLLDTGHVEDVQLGHDRLQRRGLGIGDALAFPRGRCSLTYRGSFSSSGEISTKRMLIVPAHGVHQGVDRPAKFQVAAEADRQVVQPPLLPLWMVSRSVSVWVGWLWPPSPALITGTVTVHGGHQGSTLLGMAHGDDVGVAADRAGGVGHGLALGGSGAGAEPQ